MSHLESGPGRSGSTGQPARGTIFAGVAAILLGAVCTTAPVVPAQSGIEHTERQKVRLVLLPVSVTNRHGQAVSGLGADDFQLYEDSIEQQIEYFNSEADLPVAVAFLLDLSGSMRQLGKLDRAKQAIVSFIDGLEPEDQVALVGFADDQVSWITEFTTDREVFFRRLEVQEALGATALLDAVAATPTLVDERIDGRKAIVLLTDGLDNASQMNSFSAMQLARSVEVPVYTIGLSSVSSGWLPRGAVPQSLQILGLISRETGGTLFPVYTQKEVRRAVRTLGRELRSRYLIAYRPSRQDWDGSFRRIKIETDRSGLVIRTRRGYYARP